MSLKIYSYPNNPRVFKALIAAKYNGVTVEVPAFNFGVDNKTEDFLKKNPLGKVPVLETAEGSIFESNAIARYVAKLNNNGKLYGSSAYEGGLVDQWIDFSVGEIDLPAAAWLYPIFGYLPFNKAATEKAKNDIRKVLEVLNNHLATRTFLVGERVTLADIIVVCSLLRLYENVLDAGFRKSFTNTNRWFTTVVNQPNFKAVAGEVKLAEKMAVAEEKKEAPKQEKKPQQPKAQPKPAPKDDEEEDEEKQEKKAPNPLDQLPPSPLIMDEWKRTYSNKDTRPEALPWFWQKWNEGGKEGYSIWLCDYKYNDENEKLFMTLNLLGGFIQRLEKLRKYGFGSLLIFGEEPKLEISGCWLFRGPEIPAEMKECDDYTNYEWRKADVSDPATIKLIEDFWACEGDFNGRTGFGGQYKIFK